MVASDRTLEDARRLAQRLHAALCDCPDCGGHHPERATCTGCNGDGVVFLLGGQAYNAEEFVRIHRDTLTPDQEP